MALDATSKDLHELSLEADRLVWKVVLRNITGDACVFPIEWLCHAHSNSDPNIVSGRPRLFNFWGGTGRAEKIR